MGRIQLGIRTVLLDAHAVESPAGREALTPLEVDLLRYLSEADAPVPRSQLLVAVWGYSAGVQTRAVHHAVTRLRRKLEDNPSKPLYLKTVRGLGYTLDIPAPAETEALATQLPELFGRLNDLIALSESIQSPGLLTVLGPGGVGKTHLLTHLLDRSAQRSLICDVSLSHSFESMVAEVCTAVGMASTTDMTVIAQALAAQSIGVLALDNLEQAIPAARELVSGLLSAAPGLCIIGTSRVTLRLAAERLWVLKPLPVPVGARLTDVSNSPALALFIDRVQRVNPRFEVTDESLTDVLAVLSAVDGLPLGLELAAPRTRVLSMAALADRLRRDIRLLRQHQTDSSPRHQTLTAVLRSSVDALPKDAQHLFAQLSCFAGSFTLDAVEAVADHADSAFEALETLVEHSLVVSVDGRMRLLVPVRAYAQTVLDANPVLAADTVARHRRLYATLGQTLSLRSAEQSADSALRLIVERHNLVAACEASVSAGDAETALQAALAATEGLRAGAEHAACGQLAQTLSQMPSLTPQQRLEVDMLIARGLHETGQRDQALHRMRQAEDCEDPETNALADCLRGEFHHVAGQGEEAVVALERALKRTQSDAQEWTHAIILGTYARVVGQLGRNDEAGRRYEECLRLLQGQGRHARLAPVAANFANHHRNAGNVSEATYWYEQAIVNAARSGAQRVEAVARCNRATLDAEYGRFNAAEAAFEAGLNQLRRVGDTHFEGIFLGMASELYVDQGHLDRADEALSRAYTCHHARKDTLWVNVVRARQAVVLRARGRFTEAIAAFETVLPLLKAPLLEGYAQFASQLAQAQAQNGDIDAAQGTFTHAQQLLEHGHWTLQLAECLAAEARYLAPFHPERAAEALDRARQLRDEHQRPAESRLGRAVGAAERALVG